jgi:hypothetical protein
MQSGQTSPTFFSGASKAKTGVYGHAAQDASARGIWGEIPRAMG